MIKKSKTFIQPLSDRVVIKPIGKDEIKSVSGIIIPESANKEKPERGKVVAVGPGKYDDGSRQPVEVNIGDTVLFSKYGYDEVKINNEEYYILSESSILAIIPN